MLAGFYKTEICQSRKPLSIKAYYLVTGSNFIATIPAIWQAAVSWRGKPDPGCHQGYSASRAFSAEPNRAPGNGAIRVITHVHSKRPFAADAGNAGLGDGVRTLFTCLSAGRPGAAFGTSTLGDMRIPEPIATPAPVIRLCPDSGGTAIGLGNAVEAVLSGRWNILKGAPHPILRNFRCCARDKLSCLAEGTYPVRIVRLSCNHVVTSPGPVHSGLAPVEL
jgi:hypothetical protein